MIRSICIIMTSKKTNAPNGILNSKQYIFCGFDENHDLNELNLCNLAEKLNSKLKNVFVSLKKGMLYFKAHKIRYESDHVHDLIKHDIIKRKLIFKDIGEITVLVQRYICKKCGKTIITDISDVVDENSNYAKDIRDKVIQLGADFLLSLNNIKTLFLTEHNIDLPIQTIQNWIFKDKEELPETSDRYSGYYSFDIEWIKINGKWKYRFSLIDTVTNQIVADADFTNRSETSVKKFLHDATFNKNRNAITTDLEESFKRPIDNLGFKHQFCLFHAKKNLNKAVKDYSIGLPNRKEIIKESMEQLKPIKDIFNYTDYEKAKNELMNLIYQKDKFNSVVYKIIVEKIVPNFKNYIWHIQNEKIESTSNKIENVFQKTMPKSKKRIYKSTEGYRHRVNRRNKIWNLRRKNQK